MAPPSQPDPQRTLHIPTMLGRYQVIREIACGGMATVYLARERVTGNEGRLVAIKCCHPHLRRDPVFATMFLDEARLAARIHHPNVVETLDIGEADPLYFAMEYIDGTSLAEWLKQSAADSSRKPDVGLLLRIVTDALLGLHAAHELRDELGQPLRLIHRDISPQNLLIGLDGITRIADFGIAKAERRATRTRTGQVKGKTGYMPPEQILGEPIDRRADVYAAGVVLWEALVGKRLFDAESDAAVINQVLKAQVPAPSSLCGVPTELDAIVARALRYSPNERFSTALEFAEALHATGLEIASAPAVGTALRTWVVPGDDQPNLVASPARPMSRPVKLRVGRSLAWLAVFLFASALLFFWFRPWNKPVANLAPVRPSFIQQETPSILSAPGSVPEARAAERNAASLASTDRGAPAATTPPQRSPSRTSPLSATPAGRSNIATTTRAGSGGAMTMAASAASRQPSSSEPKATKRKPAEFRPPDL